MTVDNDFYAAIYPGRTEITGGELTKAEADAVKTAIHMRLGIASLAQAKPSHPGQFDPLLQYLRRKVTELEASMGVKEKDARLLDVATLLLERPWASETSRMWSDFAEPEREQILCYYRRLIESRT